MKKSYIYLFLVLLAATGVFSSCGNNKNISDKTGMNYGKPSDGGFATNPTFKKDAPGPGLVPIEGGVFVMGGSAVDVIGQELSTYSPKREITVSSFYMDETEVSNNNWLEYLDWIKSNFPTDYEYYYNELPDTLVWRQSLSYNEPYVDNYLRHPAYQDYPVVGVTWEQANRYCVWRTDRVNEMLLRREGIMTPFDSKTPTAAASKEPFNTAVYLNGQYDDLGPKALPSQSGGAAKRPATLQDGILKQPYRLPTESEWEYAALGLIGNTSYENISENKIYPWDGLGVSSAKRRTRGLILANFKRTKGDYMGVGGSLNDKGSITVPVRSYAPNDFGLYNMAGNVNEWVEDVFRRNTFADAEAFNPYRGNFFHDKRMSDPASGKIDKDKYNRPVMVPATMGRKQTWAEKQAAAAAGNQVDSAAALAYADQRDYKDQENDELYGEITLVNNKSRVYKGGSWNDQALWLNPAARRHQQQDRASADIGFRCAMTMLGASEIRSAGKPQFKASKR